MTSDRSRIALGIAPLGLLVGLAVLTYIPDSPTPARSLSTLRPSRASSPEAKVARPASRLVKGTLSRNSTVQDLLLGQSFSPQVVHELTRETRHIYNLDRVRAGNGYTMRISAAGQLESLRYEISDEEYLLAEWNGSEYAAARHAYEFDVKTEQLSARLDESLWSTLLELGEKDELVMDLAWILQWDVDFTAIQRGDRFKLVVDKKYREGKLVKYGDIHAVQFTTGGKDFFAFRFVLPESGKVKYYDAAGKSVKKAFLKVPFRFSPRVSSGFSYSRYHPILKRRRPHLGIDFAAPRGTPVLASANGTVTFAGRKGGFGNLVKLRHPNGFQTAYGHLSRILVKAGRKVAQGDVIGRVGSTGLATGPHLDYRVQDPRGRYLNPRRRIAWPSDKPLEDRYRSDFAAVREHLLFRLDGGFASPAAPELLSTAE